MSSRPCIQVEFEYFERTLAISYALKMIMNPPSPVRKVIQQPLVLPKRF